MQKMVNVIFDSIAAALKKGEKVTLPIGTFEVLDQPRPPMRRWLLGRVRVTYAAEVRQVHPGRGVSGIRFRAGNKHVLPV